MKAKLHIQNPQGRVLVPKQVQLKDHNPDQGFRLYENEARSEEEVIRTNEVYMVLDYPGAQAGRVRIVCLGSRKVFERDQETWVIPHDISLLVAPSEKVVAPEPAPME